MLPGSEDRSARVVPADRIVVGLDPGSRRTGFAVVRSDRMGGGPCRCASGVIRLDPSLPFVERLPALRDSLQEVLDTYHPREAALETCFLSKGVQAALVLGHVRGVLLLVCLEAGLEVFEYSPSEIKRAVTGTGSAPKEQVARMLPRLLASPPESPSADESDALAAAYCHLTRPAIARARPLLARRLVRPGAPPRGGLG
ncbi:MAG: crossover junction endodeoxyribonuclease RuvC [Candidatus Eisenbacteria bacterium]|nr:crossover junction endodeoxyribonuclease RuvC [Candidatus Eisenbacteria bacterium]